MKQLLPVLLIALCYACGDTSVEEIPYTIIKGTILNTPLPKGEMSPTERAEILQKRKDINLVSTAIRSGLNVPNHQAMTDEEGNYHFLIRIEQPTEIRLQYGYAINLPLYAKPGDEIVVDIDYLHERSEISFRERNFTPLNMLVRQFKYMIAKQQKAQITADSQ